MTAITETYFENLIELLRTAKTGQADAMGTAADAIVKAARNDGRVYIFGTGHSHMLAEESHFRAGGLAITVPILAAPIMLHEGAVAGTMFERTEGMVRPIFERYDFRPGDILFVISNSGINAAPMEAALLGREAGCKIIAITSVAYSSASAQGRQRLADIADIVLDNGTPPGDAILSIPDSELKVGPASTAISVTILNAVYAEVAAQLASDGDAPIYLSANMPGAKEINQKLIKRYRPRNPHL
jgi:uncharacterized phosphosugar-binding protein